MLNVCLTIMSVIQFRYRTIFSLFEEFLNLNKSLIIILVMKTLFFKNKRLLLTILVNGNWKE